MAERPSRGPAGRSMQPMTSTELTMSRRVRRCRRCRVIRLSPESSAGRCVGARAHPQHGNDSGAVTARCCCVSRCQEGRMAAHVLTTLLRTPLRGNPARVRLKDDNRRSWYISHARHSLQGPSRWAFRPLNRGWRAELCGMVSFGHEFTVHTAAKRRPGQRAGRAIPIRCASASRCMPTTATT